MLYAARYDRSFPTKREDAAFQRRLAGRLLAYAMMEEYGVSPAELTPAWGPHGKPFFRDHPARYNLTHTAGLVCCALGEGEVGVDAERLRPVNRRLADRVCVPEERAWLSAQPDWDRAFLTLWTLKESLMKYAGDGYAFGFRNAAFTWEAGEPVPPLAGVWAKTYGAVPGFSVSLCCQGEPPKEPLFVAGDKL